MSLEDRLAAMGVIKDAPGVCLQCRRPTFKPWVGKISWRRKWQPTPVLLPGASVAPETPRTLLLLQASISALRRALGKGRCVGVRGFCLQGRGLGGGGSRVQVSDKDYVASKFIFLSYSIKSYFLV